MLLGKLRCWIRRAVLRRGHKWDRDIKPLFIGMLISYGDNPQCEFCGKRLHTFVMQRQAIDSKTVVIERKWFKIPSGDPDRDRLAGVIPLP